MEFRREDNHNADLSNVILCDQFEMISPPIPSHDILSNELPKLEEVPELDVNSNDRPESVPLRKRVRTIYTRSQIEELEREFQKSIYADSQRRHSIAIRLNLKYIQVKTWFQNRRHKAKKECNMNIIPYLRTRKSKNEKPLSSRSCSDLSEASSSTATSPELEEVCKPLNAIEVKQEAPPVQYQQQVFGYENSVPVSDFPNCAPWVENNQFYGYSGAPNFHQYYYPQQNFKPRALQNRRVFSHVANNSGGYVVQNVPSYENVPFVQNACMYQDFPHVPFVQKACMYQDSPHVPFVQKACMYQASPRVPFVQNSCVNQNPPQVPISSDCSRMIPQQDCNSQNNEISNNFSTEEIDTLVNSVLEDLIKTDEWQENNSGVTFDNLL